MNINQNGFIWDLNETVPPTPAMPRTQTMPRAQSTNAIRDDMTLADLPIAMAYVPMQKWQKIYDPDVALARGTIFAQLDLPFIGEGVE